MANTINELPLVLIDDIISRLHVLSIPHFKACCKVASNQISTESYDNMVVQHVKGQLENIVNVVKSYHVALTNNDVEQKLVKELLLQLHQNVFNTTAINCNFAIKMMFTFVMRKTNCGTLRVNATWMRYIKDLPLIEGDDVILDAFKCFLLGTDKSMYIVSFNYIDNRSKNKSHYCTTNLQFHDNGDVKMNFSIEDGCGHGYAWTLWSNEMKRIVQKSVRSMEIIVDDATLTDLAECIVANLGRKTCLSRIKVVNNIDKWVGDFTKYAETTFDNAINSFVNPTTYRDEIINILS